jgi:hypothetical protein
VLDSSSYSDTAKLGCALGELLAITATVSIGMHFTMLAERQELEGRCRLFVRPMSSCPRRRRATVVQ